MRIYYDIQPERPERSPSASCTARTIVKAGRYFIAKTLLELGAATVDPLSPANPLIFSAGPFAGTSFSNANRTSVGCKSPLTGGIKEANGGGSFSYGLGQQKIAGFTLLDASPGLGGDPLQEGRHHRVRRRRALPRQGQLRGPGRCCTPSTARRSRSRSAARWASTRGSSRASRSATRTAGPARLSARGGVGAVMGAKKVKAIVVDLDKIPPFSEPKKVNAAIKDYAKMLQADSMVANFYAKIGTMGMADLQNTLGGLPVRNFSAGQLADVVQGREVQDGRRVHQPAQRLARRRAHPRLHARLRDPVQQHLRGRRRQGSGLAGRVRDARAARHQLRPHRSRRPRPDELHRQRPGRGHHRDRAP